ncbi:MAG: T9SS type A sorting domain-containing protein, partial [Ginsengibacter sp.]
ESQIRQLIARLEAFVANRKINRIEGRILTSILDAALRENREGDKKGTIRDLELFQAITKFFIRSNNISKELVSGAQKIINQLKDIEGSADNLKTDKLSNSKTNDISESKEMRSFNIYGNYPNPFSTSTTISFDLVDQSYIKLFIYDESGRMVTTLLDQTLPAGLHNITWQPGNLPAGVYFAQIRKGNFIKTSRMMHVK